MSGSITGPVLGIDPGHTIGAAVLLDSDGCSVIRSWRWLRGTSGDYALWTADPGEEPPRLGARVATLSHALDEVVDFSDNQLCAMAVVEGLFVPPQAKASAVLPLAEAAGRALALVELEGIEVIRPKASQWRAATMRSCPRSTDAAKAYALSQAPYVFSGLAMRDRHDVVEAAFMARCGWLKLRERAQLKAARGRR